MPLPVIDLTGLSVGDGFDLNSPRGRYAYLGHSVSNAGDVNGDGIDDIIVGAFRGFYQNGAAYVIYGKAGSVRSTIDLASLSASDGFAMRGAINGSAEVGFDVSAAGDVNNDGIDDLLVSSRTGRAYVIYGQTGPRPTLTLDNLAPNVGFAVQTTIAVGNVITVSDAGDVNGDGIDDIIVGNPYGNGPPAGTVYVIYGIDDPNRTRQTLTLSSLSASDGFTINGQYSGDKVGWQVSDAGDINGDGIGDLIIGATGTDDNGADSGEAYVIYGRAGASRSAVNIANLPASDGFVLRGEFALDFAGYSVSSAGDVNGDGIDDLIVGAPTIRNGGVSKAYIVYGRNDPVGTRGTILLGSLSNQDGFSIQGGANDRVLGRGVSTAGDFNGDGIDDLIIGVPGANGAYVVFGRSNGRSNIVLSDLQAGDGFFIDGEASNDSAGSSVSSAGDVNGDGIDDLLIGARTASTGDFKSGGAHIVYGRLEAGAIGGTGADNFLTGTAAADAIYGLAGNDLLYGDIGNDRLFGADGSDALFGQAGDDVLSGGADSDKLDGGADNDIVNGGADGDSMRGGDGDDVLDGGSGNDAMNGGTGVDIFTGGEGRDKFRFRDGDTGNTIATADRITDLDQAQGERISLTMMDAIVGGVDDAFTFIGTAGFGNIAGQLRYELIGGNTYVMGDTNGDGASDFMIRLDGAVVLTGADFSL